MQRFALRHLALGIIVLASAFIEVSTAQIAPFSHLDISLTAHQNVPSNDAFYEFFGTGFGFGGNLKTPFYIGTADIGLQWHKYRKNLVTVPKMTALFMYAGWGYPLRMGALEIEPSFRLGNYRMMFEMDNAFKSELDESEFTTALHARAQLFVGSKAAVHVEASRMTVYTYNRLYYNYVGGGVSYRMRTSKAVQGALRK
jgi:hypothetical protein